MAELGNIQKSFGKQIGIAVANTYGYSVMNSNSLPANNIIISSPVNGDGNDVAPANILVTDYNGTPVRLTYSFNEGNGLQHTGDSLEIQIDNKTLIVNDKNELSINIESLIDNKTLLYEDSKIVFNTQNLKVATQSEPGVFLIDENTIKNIDGQLYVETSNLDRANEEQQGIVTSDNNTINISQDGVVSVNVENLTKSSDVELGVVKPDGSTLNINEGKLYVDTNSLLGATNNSFGVVKPDNKTIISNDGVISVNSNNLQYSSKTNFGVIKPDNVSTEIVNDTLCVKNYSSLLNTLSSIKSKLNNVNIMLNNIQTQIDNYSSDSAEYTTPTIFSFMCNAVTSASLTKPAYGLFAGELQKETITAEFTVNTNCPFTLSVDYINNVNPHIYLYEINYDDLQTFPGTTGLTETFQTTNHKDKILRFSFVCKNFANSVGKNTETTKIQLTVSYKDDATISKSVIYNIVRYNSLYNSNQIGDTIISGNPDNSLQLQ